MTAQHAYTATAPATAIDTTAYEVGSRFTFTTVKTVLGIRIWNPGLASVAVRTARVWNWDTAALLGSVVIPSTLPTGWSEYLLSSSISGLSLGVNYMVSYNVGGVATNDFGFLTNGTNPDVTSSDGYVTIDKSSFNTTQGSMPAAGNIADNFYGVDVIYDDGTPYAPQSYMIQPPGDGGVRVGVIPGADGGSTVTDYDYQSAIQMTRIDRGQVATTPGVSATNTVVSASFAPAANSKLYVVAYANVAITPVGSMLVTISDSFGGLSWSPTTVTSTRSGYTSRLTIFTADIGGVSPGSGTITITRSAGSADQWLIADFREITNAATGVLANFDWTGNGPTVTSITNTLLTVPEAFSFVVAAAANDQQTTANMTQPTNMTMDNNTAVSWGSEMAHAIQFGAAQALTWTFPTTGGQLNLAIAVEIPVSWSTFTDGTSLRPYGIVTGLTNGTSYVLRSRADNAVGNGAWSRAVGPMVPYARNTPNTFNGRAPAPLRSTWLKSFTQMLRLRGDEPQIWRQAEFGASPIVRLSRFMRQAITRSAVR